MARRIDDHPDLFDICARKHGGNEESVAAFESTPAEIRRQTQLRIYKFAFEAGERGITADEVALAFGVVHNVVAPRISELRAAGYLVAAAGRRPTRLGRSARILITDKEAERQRRALIEEAGNG